MCVEVQSIAQKVFKMSSAHLRHIVRYFLHGTKRRLGRTDEDEHPPETRHYRMEPRWP